MKQYKEMNLEERKAARSLVREQLGKEAEFEMLAGSDTEAQLKYEIAYKKANGLTPSVEEKRASILKAMRK